MGIDLVLPDMVLSSMLTVVGLRLCRWIQLCLLAPGPGLGLYPGLLATLGDPVLPYIEDGRPDADMDLDDTDMDLVEPPAADLTDMAGLATLRHWVQVS